MSVSEGRGRDLQWAAWDGSGWGLPLHETEGAGSQPYGSLSVPRWQKRNRKVFSPEGLRFLGVIRHPALC